MTEKIKIDISGCVEINITPELKELLDKSKTDFYDVLNEIYDCLNKELYKKDVVKIDEIYNWTY